MKTTVLSETGQPILQYFQLSTHTHTRPTHLKCSLVALNDWLVHGVSFSEQFTNQPVNRKTNQGQEAARAEVNINKASLWTLQLSCCLFITSALTQNNRYDETLLECL